MSVDQIDLPTSRTPEPDRKAEILLYRDLAMMSSACRYNLADPAERDRSVRDLSRLFFHLSRICEVDLFIEAGAKDGSSSRRARRLLNPRWVVAFEANPFTYRRFAGLNTDIEYEHLALADRPGTITFHLKRDEDGAPRADGQASLLRRDSVQPGDSVEVSVPSTTLDSYFAHHDFSRAAAWVDVEGAAHLVLTGGQSVLDRTAVVIIEVEDRRYWGADQWLRPEVLSYLYDRGLVPVARDFQSRYQYNVVLVRSELLDNVDQLRWAMTLFSSNAYGADSVDVPVDPPRQRSRVVRAADRFRRRLRRMGARARESVAPALRAMTRGGAPDR